MAELTHPPLTVNLTSASQNSSTLKIQGKFNVDIDAAPSAGNVLLQRQYPHDTTWYTVASYSKAESERGYEAEPGVSYRISSDGSFSGSVNVRVGRDRA